MKFYQTKGKNFVLKGDNVVVIFFFKYENNN